MKLIKAILLTVALSVSMSAFAMTDDEHVEYTQALRDGNVKLVKKFLDNGVEVNHQFFAWEALQIAANNNRLEVVKVLVEKGADLDYQHPLTKMTALDLAAFDGYTDVVTYLLSKGANPNLKLRGDVSIVRAVRDTGNTKMVELLMAGGAKDDGCKEEKCL
jgi:ankyrin repeat protein